MVKLFLLTILALMATNLKIYAETSQWVKVANKLDEYFYNETDLHMQPELKFQGVTEDQDPCTVQVNKYFDNDRLSELIISVTYTVPQGTKISTSFDLNKKTKLNDVDINDDVILIDQRNSEVNYFGNSKEYRAELKIDKLNNKTAVRVRRAGWPYSFLTTNFKSCIY